MNVSRSRHFSFSKNERVPSEQSRSRQSSPQERMIDPRNESTATWKRRRRDSLEEKIHRTADEMLGNTSCLALGNIFIRKHAILKALWCIAFIVCCIFTIRQLYFLSASYFTYPTSTTIELKYSDLEFPSVTVCNLNPIRNSVYPSLAKPALIEFLKQLNARFESGPQADNGTEIDTRTEDWKTYRMLISNETKETRFKMGHQMSDFILQCSFNGEKCDVNRLLSVSNSKRYGNCYTFNPYRNVNKSKPLVTKDGRENGLLMTLFIEHNEYLTNLVPSAGIRVHVHQPRTLELPEIYGFSVPPGFESALGVSVDKIIRLGKPYGNCSTGINFETRYRTLYTYKACMAACKENILEKTCKCRELYRTMGEGDHSLPVCNQAQEFQCLVKTHLNETFMSEACDCRLPCEEIKYKVIHSLAQWPADGYARRLSADLADINAKMLNVFHNRSLARKSLINLIIYQEDTFFNVIEQKPAYKWENYVSDVGGSLSLFLGFSVLTGFEFLEIMCLLLTYFLGKLIYMERDGDEQDYEDSTLVESEKKKLPQ